MLSERPWKLDGVLRLMVGILVCVAFFILLQGAVQHFIGKEKFAEGTLLFGLFSSLTLHGSILIGTAFYLFSERLGWSALFGFNTPPLGRVLLYGVLGTIVFLPVGMVLQNVSIELLTRFTHSEPDKQAAVVEFSKTVNWSGRVYLVFFAVVLAPLAEEILFRGFVFGILRQAGYRALAFWTSALLFAASHANAAIFVPLLVLGLLFAWLYEKTDNLLASITAHSLFNAVNLVLLFAGDYLEQTVGPHLHSR